MPGDAENEILDRPVSPIADPEATRFAPGQQTLRRSAGQRFDLDDLHVTVAPPPALLDHPNCRRRGLRGIGTLIGGIGSVPRYHRIDGTHGDLAAAFEIQGAVGKAGDEVEVVGDQTPWSPRADASARDDRGSVW